jgi:Na+-translocating ferredoxin:NAD+ oxidoreductase RnfG subunit
MEREVNKKYLKVFIFLLCVIIAILLYQLKYDKYEMILDNMEFYEFNEKDYDRLNDFESEKIIRCYINSEKEVIQVVKTEGYNDDIILFVAINESEIKKVEVFFENESEGYGDYLKEEWFLNRLKVKIDKKLKVVKIINKESNEIVAITGATITTESIVNALNNCIVNYEEALNEF